MNDEIVPYNGGSYFFSAGASSRSGIEASIEARFAFGFQWHSAFTMLKGSYDAYANDLGNFSGNVAPGIPELTWNNRIRWLSEWGFSTSLTVNATSSYFADDANSFAVPSATVIHAAASYQIRIGSIVLELSGGVQNLSDANYAASAFINPNGGAYLEPGLPRNLYGTLQLRTDL
jgi:iron complex outermembrane receptor protein